MPARPGLVLFVAACLLTAACTTAAIGETASSTTEATSATSTTSTTTSTTSTTTSTTSTTATTTTTVPTYDVVGTVTSIEGAAIPNAVVTLEGRIDVTDRAGRFSFVSVPAAPIAVNRPAYLGTALLWDGSDGEVTIVLERDPFVTRAVRVSRYVASDPEMYADLLETIDGTVINSLVFDTKDESGSVLYDTSVDEAHRLGAVDAEYDPADYLEAAREAGLYTITRIVSFEDKVRVRAAPETKLIGDWVDITAPANWEYLLDLAVEACELGFDEIQFDYIRFPAGITGAALASRGEFTQDDRIAAVTGFLGEAGDRLTPMGCATSADIFGIVMNAPNDQGIGQRPEEVSQVVDYVSPMLYPSHYSPGTLGYDDPNSAPAPITAWALDAGAGRVEDPAVIRPWLQAFYYSASQIGAQIDEAEERGMGWMLWNAAGNYPRSWLPDGE